MEQTDFKLQKRSSTLENDGKCLHVIKNFYDTYIPQVTSQKVDCSCHVTKNCPRHGHIISLMEHVLDSKDKLLFCMHMKLLKHTCMLSDDISDKHLLYPTEPPIFIDPLIGQKLKGYYIA